MSNDRTFNITNQNAGGDINNIQGDYYAVDEQVLRDILQSIDLMKNATLDAIQDSDLKLQAEKALGDAKDALGSEQVDQEDLAGNLKRVNTVLKEANASSNAIAAIGGHVAKIAGWLGTTSDKLGWFSSL